MFFVKFLVLSAVVTTCFADLRYRIESYWNSDIVNNENPFANVEVHCFLIDNGNHPRYVRGTYGNRGYFEGPIDNAGVAHVNYIEVGYAYEDGLTPTAGAGILKYNSNYNVTEGIFWSSGAQSDYRQGGLSNWDILGKVSYFGAPNDWNDAQIAEQYCFWDITDTAKYTREHIHYKPWWVLGVANPNTWYTLNVGFQESLGGAIAGAYRYTYSTEDCNNLYNGCKKGRVEWGIYSQETAAAGFNSSLLLATEWKATSGPLSGESGSALYAIVAGADGKAKQIGFFCNSKRNNDPNLPPYKKILTSCSYDSNNQEQPDTAASRKLSQALLKTYAKKEYAYWWHNLSVFISTIFGNHFSAFIESAAVPIAEVDAVDPAAVDEAPAVVASGRRLLDSVASWWEKIWA